MEQKKTGREFKNFIYTVLAKYGKAISDPKRVEILDLLVQAEKNVEILSKEIGMSVAATSHHLQILKECKLVRDRREGRNIFYQIESAGISVFDTISSAGKQFNAEIQVEMDSFFDPEQKLDELEYKDFIKRVLSKELILIDVRPEYEYNAGHVPGSISIPLKELRSQISKLPKRKKILAYCRGKYCVLSEEAVKLLRSEGFQAYRVENGPLEFSSLGVKFRKS
ncbi:ArsR family transcriptional regulator [Leptospira langatensis]|uniref:ArsR family transcriptional regulator n=1 Tax=Leptospira langatensis TaxID=2484983 RepID=A0A5F1ZRT8_9LEPT|nr:metalloregulator ArsR/SmtB family transcription factor [Leptospira langatensis]TGJ98939.1 ArsR family transcriptional regulator [Leptospira langatensis]TGL40492.1 ArsR family transcriptional regulator [Leptospira langatensis]